MFVASPLLSALLTVAPVGDPAAPAAVGDVAVTAVDVAAVAAADEPVLAVDEGDVLAGELPTPVVWSSRGLLDIVPAETSSAFHKLSDARSALADGYAADVAQAVCDAQFDEFVFETLTTAGAPPELVTELRGYRNLLATFAGAIPWVDVLGREFVYAEAAEPAFGSEGGMPGMLLACRPGTAQAEDTERSLAMLLGALTTASPIHARLDIQELPRDGGPLTKHYALRVPLDRDVTLVQLAVRDDTILIGIGDRYFHEALNLLRENDGKRLLATQRFQDAVKLLPSDVTATHYLDVRRRVDTVEDVVRLVEDRAFHAGFWQSSLNDMLKLYDHVETIATATRCVGDQVVMETVTRFDPEATQQNPWYQAGLAKRASPELLDYVPADAIAFQMQGEVRVAPIFHAVMAEVEARYDWAGPVLMACRVLGAAADFSIERDVLSWVGSEHIVVTMPSRKKHAQATDVDTVTLWKLDDPAGMKKCLARLEGVYNELIPPMMTELRGKLEELDVPFTADLAVVQSEGMFPSLRKLQLDIVKLDDDGSRNHIPVPAVHFGVLGDSFVITPSQEALESCMAAAAFMEPGLEERPLAADLIGRGDLTSARLDPYGRGMQEAVGGIVALQGFALPMLRAAVGETEYAWTADALGDLLGRVTGVLESIDFLGDAVTWSERRAGGLVQYECTTLQLAPAEVGDEAPAGGASDPLVSR